MSSFPISRVHVCTSKSEVRGRDPPDVEGSLRVDVFLWAPPYANSIGGSDNSEVISLSQFLFLYAKLTG